MSVTSLPVLRSIGAARWRVVLAASLVAVASLCFSPASRAELTLAYSFEFEDLQGFGPNGGGVTIAPDTVGATEGTGSMSMSIVQGATFVGAITGFLAPEFGDPPGLEVIVFDLTITQAFPNNTGDFVDAGITVFGSSQPDYPGGQLGGLGVQFFNNQVPLSDLTVGTHEIVMPLSSATHPLTFATGKSFNDIFGGFGTGENDVIPTGFQIYINKSNTAPWTGYFDNIRIGTLPTPDADFNDDGLVDATDLQLWKGAFGATPGGDANGDGVSDGADFLLWQQQLGPVPPVTAVPEPATFGIGGVALAVCGAIARRRMGSCRRVV